MKTLITQLSLTIFILLLIVACGESVESTESGNSPEKNDMSDNTTTDESPQNIDGPFQVKAGVIHYDMMKLDGTLKATYTLYFDNFGNTIKLEETMDKETSIFVYDKNSGYGATKWAGKEKPIKIFMKQGEINTFAAIRSTSGFTQMDDEILLGKKCAVYANNARSADGDSQLTYWQHEGVTLKEINRLGTGYMFEATKFEVKAVAKSAFELMDEI